MKRATAAEIPRRTTEKRHAASQSEMLPSDFDRTAAQRLEAITDKDSDTWRRRSLRQESVHTHACSSAHVHLAVHDRRRSEVAGVAQPIPTPGSLVGIVEFLRNVGGIVSMQHRRETVIDGPDDAVVRAVGRDRRLELTLLWVRVVSVRF
jgi:hypothetical protein